MKSALCFAFAWLMGLGLVFGMPGDYITGYLVITALFLAIGLFAAGIVFLDS